MFGIDGSNHSKSTVCLSDRHQAAAGALTSEHIPHVL